MQDAERVVRTLLNKFRNLVALALVSTATVAGISVAHSAQRSYQRIISLSPSGTENLFAMGAGKQVIAVSSDSNFPSSAPVTSLDAFTPNIESIAALKPDLVILNSGATKAASVRAGLEKLKIDVYMENAPTNLSGAYKEIMDLGHLTGNTPGAYKTVTLMKSKISKALAAGRRIKNVTFFHEIDNTYYSITSNTFIGSVYKSFGFTNIADAAATADSYGYPQLTPEYIIKANPDYIFLSDAQYGESLSTVSKRSGWTNTKAVSRKQVIALPDDISSRWGPRLADFYTFIASVVKK